MNTIKQRTFPQNLDRAPSTTPRVEIRLAALNEHAREALSSLDQYSAEHSQETGVLDCAKDIVGVVSGIKQAALVTVGPDAAQTYSAVFSGLGLRSRNHGDTGVILVSGDEGTLDALDSALSRSQAVAQDENDPRPFWAKIDENAEREIGWLLGYPKSAVEDYVQSHKPQPEDMYDAEQALARFEEIPSLNSPKLSLKSWREELKEYYLPLMEAMRLLTPRTYEQLGAKYKNIAGILLPIAGVESPKK